MELITGRPISPGMAVGPIHILQRDGEQASPSSASTVPQRELERFHLACRQTAQALRAQEDSARTQAGQTGADILHIHAMLLEDPDFLETAEALIREGTPAHQAALEAGRCFAAAFSALEDPYLRARSADVTEVAQQVADHLTGRQEGPLPPSPVLLAAAALAPGQLLRWGKERLLGLILTACSPASHTAILARTMGVPLIVVPALSQDWQGQRAALDGSAGQLWLDPDEAVLARFTAALDSCQPPDQLATLPSVTQDGRKVILLSNIGGPAEAAAALEQGAEGIGLFRSEFLFLDQERCPDEETQFALYRQTVQAMAGHRVVIRTLDAGADKPLPYLDLPAEENPALGCRGIRLSLARPELFRPQLRAILRAAVYGPVSVMFPMVSAPQEVIRAKKLLEECRRALEAEGTAAGPLEIGVMIVTPAAALMADQLAREVSFFSIGTNDLTQYTLAADRQSAGSYDPHHPAVLELIRMSVESAHRHGCRAAVCGELAADLEMTAQLLRLGVNELSVSPSALLPLRRHIRQLNLN